MCMKPKLFVIKQHKQCLSYYIKPLTNSLNYTIKLHKPLYKSSIASRDVLFRPRTLQPPRTLVKAFFVILIILVGNCLIISRMFLFTVLVDTANPIDGSGSRSDVILF
jgi:hypothetical protein